MTMQTPTRLFNEYEAMNEAGKDLAKCTADLLTETIKAYGDSGYSYRDIQLIINSEVNLIVSELSLKKTFKRLKER